MLLAFVAVPCVFGYFEVAADGADEGAGFQHAEDLLLVVMQNLLFARADSYVSYNNGSSW